MGLVSHLGDQLILGRRFGENPSFVNGMGQGLLTVYVLAQVHGGHGGDGMDMIGSAYGDCVNVLLLVEHFPEIRINFGFRKSFDAFGSSCRIHVAKRHDIRTGFGGARHVGRSLASDSDPGYVDALVGSPCSGGKN